MFEFNFFNFNIDFGRIFNRKDNIIKYNSELGGSIQIPPNTISQTKNTLIKTGSGSITVNDKASITQKN